MEHSALVSGLLHLLVTGVSVFLVAKLMPGMQAKGFTSAVGFAIVVAILNAIAWHLFALLTVPFAFLTLGIGALIINTFIFLLADKLVDGVKFSGCVTAGLASLAVSFVNTVLEALLGMK
jgi:putative membrane protein